MFVKNIDSVRLRYYCESSSFGRAVAFQASGGQFEPGLSLNAASSGIYPTCVALSPVNGLEAVVAQG